jgi:hypothetical protein
VTGFVEKENRGILQAMPETFNIALLTSLPAHGIA